MLAKVGIVAFSGAIGTTARFCLMLLMGRVLGDTFPWGTMAVNLIGCFLAGMSWVYFENRLDLSPEIRLLVLVGFMGAFTTFSSLILESGTYLSTSKWWVGVLNLLAHNAIGLTALFGGISVGRCFSL
jgi:fluoride exporter